MSNPPLPNIPSPDIRAAIQAARDADHLRLLEIGFYISGVLTALRFLWFCIIGLFFAFGGVAAAISAAHDQSSHDAPPAFVFILVAVIFGALILFSLIFAVLEIYAGICLKNRKHPILIQIVAGFYCLSIPWGTALGVFTFMVLNRDSVKPLFSPK